MAEYQLEIKQIVDYPRCRLCRQFIQSLMADTNIRTEGGSGLFHYTVLFCFANTKTSHRRVEGVNYTICPGEWLGTTEELIYLLGVHNRNQALTILKNLQKRHIISFKILSDGFCVKYKIIDWNIYNRVYEYNAPCHRDNGFFYIPIFLANEIISARRPSEMDALLDLWINAIYNDEQMQGSAVGPIVYLRNGSGKARIHYETLERRWNMSRETLEKYLNKLSSLGYISIITPPGIYGMIIYLNDKLSNMFRLMDTLLDKEEISMSLKIKLELDDSITYGDFILSKACTETVIKKLEKIISAQGVPCFGCRKFEYRLLRLSGYKEKPILPATAPPQQNPRYRLIYRCGGDTQTLAFELNVRPVFHSKGGAENDEEERSG